MIIFYDKEHEAQLAKLQARFHIDATLSFPILEDELAKAIEQLTN